MRRVLLICATLAAVSPVAAGRAAVSVAQWIEPDEGIVARQQVDLYIEVATDGFFSGGTTIAEFEIPGVVVLRRDPFAVNSTRVTEGVSWAVQRWKIALYPQRSGDFEVPAVTVGVVSGPAAQRIETATRGFGFSVRLPEGLSDRGDWVAAPELAVRETYDRTDSGLETLAPGDAIVRVVELQAVDTVAMMLPDVDFTAPAGVSVYRDPPRLEDAVNRGTSRASRRETITYVIEKAGRYELPRIDLFWWDTGRGETRQHSLPARVLATRGFAEADGPLAGAPAEAAEPEVGLPVLRTLTAVASVLLLLLGLGWLVRRTVGQDRHPSLDRQLDRALRRGNARDLVALLYRWLDVRRGAEAVRGQSARTGSMGNRACTLRAYIATLQRAELESARAAVMRMGFGPTDDEAARAPGQVKAAASNRRLLRILRRMTRPVPGTAATAPGRFRLNGCGSGRRR